MLIGRTVLADSCVTTVSLCIDLSCVHTFKHIHLQPFQKAVPPTVIIFNVKFTILFGVEKKRLPSFVLDFVNIENCRLCNVTVRCGMSVYRRFVTLTLCAFWSLMHRFLSKRREGLTQRLNPQLCCREHLRISHSYQVCWRLALLCTYLQFWRSRTNIILKKQPTSQTLTLPTNAQFHCYAFHI